MTTALVSMLLLIGFGVALLKNALRGWVVGLGGPPNAVEGPVAIALMLLLGFVPVVLLLLRDLLDQLVLARTPAECWGDSLISNFSKTLSRWPCSRKIR